MHIGDLASLRGRNEVVFPGAASSRDKILVHEGHVEEDSGTRDASQPNRCKDANRRSLSTSIEKPNDERPPAIDPEDGQWEVERLIEKRQFGKTVKYLVKWLGYPSSENSWEKRKDIDPHVVSTFEAELLQGSRP